MSITDEKGLVYQVENPDKLLSSADNDELITILQQTYMSRCWIDDQKKIVDPDESIDKIINDLDEGIIFLKEHLSTLFSEESIQHFLEVARIRLYSRNNTINDN